MDGSHTVTPSGMYSDGSCESFSSIVLMFQWNIMTSISRNSSANLEGSSSLDDCISTGAAVECSEEHFSSTNFQRGDRGEMSGIRRGATIFAMLKSVDCCFAIVDCCAALIPSSNANKIMVQTASTATPPTTSNVVIDKTFSDSRMMPQATAAEPTTLIEIRAKWGQNEATDPEKKALIGIYFLAVTGWGIVAVVATIKFSRMKRKQKAERSC